MGKEAVLADTQRGRVKQPKGWASEKSDFFSILLKRVA